MDCLKSLRGGALRWEGKERISAVVAAGFLSCSKGRERWGWAAAWEDLRKYNARGKCHLIWPNQNVTLTNYE